MNSMSDRFESPRRSRNPGVFDRPSGWTIALLLPILAAGCCGGVKSGQDEGLSGDQEDAAAILDREMAEDEGPGEDPTNILDQP